MSQLRKPEGFKFGTLKDADPCGHVVEARVVSDRMRIVVAGSNSS